ncbi:hypothetical protein MNBD_PLANCTO03-148, partial [hydrothermal vent metagenome]
MQTKTTLPCFLLLVLVGAAGAGETDALSRELLADAAARVSLQSGSTAGHDGKFFLASAKGGFRLNISGQIQVRYHLNLRETTSPDKDITTGFNLRRTKIGFDGVVAGDWEYKLVGAFDRDGGSDFLEDAILSREFANGITLTWG